MDKKHNTSPSHRSLGTRNIVLFFYYTHPSGRDKVEIMIYNVDIYHRYNISVKRTNIQSTIVKLLLLLNELLLYPVFNFFLSFLLLFYFILFCFFFITNKFENHLIELSFITNKSFLSSRLLR